MELGGAPPNARLQVRYLFACNPASRGAMCRWSILTLGSGPRLSPTAGVKSRLLVAQICESRLLFTFCWAADGADSKLCVCVCVCVCADSKPSNASRHASFKVHMSLIASIRSLGSKLQHTKDLWTWHSWAGSTHAALPRENRRCTTVCYRLCNHGRRFRREHKRKNNRLVL